MKLTSKEIAQILQMEATTDAKRREEWIKNQDALMEIHDLLIVPYQGIALIDAQLVIEDKNIVDGNSTGFKGDLGPHLTQSYLWVLGAYEIIRTMSQYADNGKDTKISQFKDEIRKLKHTFERLRVPLAKFEAARKNPEGHTYAYPIFDKVLGTCWSISNTEFISRRLLSDDFLKIMEKLAN